MPKGGAKRIDDVDVDESMSSMCSGCVITATIDPLMTVIAPAMSSTAPTAIPVEEALVSA